MKGRKHCAVGGVLPPTSVGRRGRTKPVLHEDEGPPVVGKISSMRLDRPGRKLGGRCGAELSPLSMAGKTS